MDVFICKFADYLFNVKFDDETKKLGRRVVMNYSASELPEANDLYKIMPQHIKSPVRWRETINVIIDSSAQIIAIGPGVVQASMIKRDYGYSNVIALDTADAIDEFCSSAT